MRATGRSRESDLETHIFLLAFLVLFDFVINCLYLTLLQIGASEANSPS